MINVVGCGNCGNKDTRFLRLLVWWIGRPDQFFSILQSRGGIYYPKPTARASALTLAEREEISRGLAKGLSIWGIAQRINRAASSVSREISRNKGRENYRAVDAQDRAIRARARPQKLPS